MTATKSIGCRELSEVAPVQCCGSCHDEWDEGYGDPLDWEAGGVRLIGCCGAMAATDGMGDEEIARLYAAAWEKRQAVRARFQEQKRETEMSDLTEEKDRVDCVDQQNAEYHAIERTPGGSLKQRRCPHCDRLTTKGNFEADSIWRHVCLPKMFTEGAEQSLRKRGQQAGDPGLDDPESPSWDEVRSLMAELDWARRMGAVLGWASVATTTGGRSKKYHLLVDHGVGSARPACGISAKVFDPEIRHTTLPKFRCDRCDRSPWGRDLEWDFERRPSDGSRSHVHFPRGDGGW